MIVDITGPIAPGMWHYDDPYFEPRITELPSPTWMDAEIHQQAIAMPLQTGTYLETAAHVYPGRELVDEVALERVVMLPSLAVHLDVDPGAGIDAAMLSGAIGRFVEPSWLEGRGLIVGTGWASRWMSDDFLTDGPYFTPCAIDLVVAAKVGILGADLPRFDDPQRPTGHLGRFFEGDALMLAPLGELDRVPSGLGRLIATPLRMAGVSASPVRAVWIADD